LYEMAPRKRNNGNILNVVKILHTINRC
jgi:hypothetical protein